jgi:hypothetical protein
VVAGGETLTALIAWISCVIAVALAAASLLFVGSGAVEGQYLVALAAPAYAAVALAIALRRPENRLHWVLRLIALALPALPLAGSLREAWLHDPNAYPLWPWFAWIGNGLWGLSAGLCLTLLPLLFPTGSPPSARWRPFGWFVVGVFVLQAADDVFRPRQLASDPGYGTNPLGLSGPIGDLFVLLTAPLPLGFIIAVLGCLASVVVRFRRARGVERQQMKWFVYAVAFGTLSLLLNVAGNVMGMVGPGGSGVNLAIANVGSLLLAISFVLMPISVGVAILRYRLYDIDVLINRTLVYGPLSAALAATYFAVVVVLGAALRPLTDGSEVAVALSTLLVLALFAPLRRRIQGAVDRRFFRSRYDAAHTLDAFGERLRDEVDLDSVRADLLDVVRDTVRPAHASVWLRER